MSLTQTRLAELVAARDAAAAVQAAQAAAAAAADAAAAARVTAAQAAGVDLAERSLSWAAITRLSTSSDATHWPRSLVASVLSPADLAAVELCTDAEARAFLQGVASVFDTVGAA